MTTFSRSQTLASSPNSFLKMPMVPGPQTSCVMSTSMSTHTFSPGSSAARSDALARIFSVIVIAVFTWRGATARIRTYVNRTRSAEQQQQRDGIQGAGAYRAGGRRGAGGARRRRDGAHAARLGPAARARAVRRRRGQLLLRREMEGGWLVTGRERG
jgi:hypothetical protein